MIEICGIVVALLSAQPAGGNGISNVWLEPKVGDSPFVPDRAEVLRGYPQAARKWAALFDRKARKLPAADCAAEFRAAGYKLAPWPATRTTLRAGDTSPDGNPQVSFNQAIVSGDGKFALLAWLSSYAPLASSFRYAILEKTRSGWRIAGSAGFGPVS